MSWREFQIEPASDHPAGGRLRDSHGVRRSPPRRIILIGLPWNVGFLARRIVAPPDVVAPLAYRPQSSDCRADLVVLEGEGLGE